MPEKYDVAIKIVSQNGICPRGHKVSEEWIINDKTPEGICIDAFQSLMPHMQVLMYGGSFTWGDDVTTEACPDPNNPVVFELRRLSK